ncbi:hypothetical protein [Actinomadura macra]|uniref:hypothetical protein n=1 Tax=Actinomadura macra TaxID=46164 RepID=UPI0008326DD7|nr:hypothetical protein [Actinomadura macra]
MIERIAVETATFLVLAVAAAGNWAAWLGWDQERDVHPDGHETGPYQVWQVVGLVVVLTMLCVVAAALRRLVTAVAAPALGTMTALCLDWSDDDTGLWVVGAALVLLGLLAGGLVIAVLAYGVQNRRAGSAGGGARSAG